MLSVQGDRLTLGTPEGITIRILSQCGSRLFQSGLYL